MKRSLLLAVAAALLVPGSVSAGTGSLPGVSQGPLPGPAVLHEPLATAPQLENTGIWEAEPLLVSGADAYVAGEYLYQDFIYDSYGADTTPAAAPPQPVPPSTSLTFGSMTGDVVYPTDVATYGNNAADLLEFRARLTDEGIAYRLTLNTMLVPDAAAIAIGRGDCSVTTQTSDWGYGIGDLGVTPCETIVTWGTGAEIDGTSILASVDVARNQIEVHAPMPAASLGRQVAHWAVVGLWDASAHRFKEILEQPNETMPGGAHGTDPPPIFNVAFRFHEPMGFIDAETGQRTAGYGHWREHAQAKALAARDISGFGVEIDLDKLEAEVTESNVPTHGYLNRLFSSHLDLGEGARATRPMLVGKVQPYAVWVPSSYEPGTPAPLHIHLHSLSAVYNQYMVFSPDTFRDLGEDRGAFVLSPMGRGPNGWWHSEAEVDLFEAWADLAARYDLDPERVTVGGYSMGGYGTYRMTALYPDLFVKGFAIVGPADEDILGGPTGGMIDSPHNSMRVAENIYNVPLWMWKGLLDELVPIIGPVRHAQRLHELGYRHELRVFPAADHFALSVLDEWGPAAGFLGLDPIDRDPARVVYKVRPSMGSAALGLVHDKAYWVSDIEVTGAEGMVDVRSLADGVGEPVRAEILGPGIDPAPHVARGITWTGMTSVQAENAIEAALTGVSALTVWIERAGIDLGEPYRVRITSTVPGTLTLAGSFGHIQIPYGIGTTLWLSELG